MNSTTFIDNMQLPVHRWFRYSAGFSAQWVESLVKEAGDAADVHVLDPFAGSGTTLLAAQAAGAASIGVESHPFVARVARAKLLWQADPALFRQRAAACLERAADIEDPSPAALLSKCYTDDLLATLLGLRDAVLAEPDEIGELLWLAFVAIVRKVSHVGTAQWQYVLPNKRKRKTLGVDEAFRAQVADMATDMEWRQTQVAAPVTAVLVEGDARAASSYEPEWATHVVCSPPYANNYDYADATRLEMTVLGEVSGWGDLKGIRDRLVHSCSQHMARYDGEAALASPALAPIVDELRPVYDALLEERDKHGGKKAYHLMVAAYFLDLAEVWSAVRTASRPGATVCYVIGDSAPYGVHVPVEKWLGELAVAAGFTSWRFEKVRDRNTKWKNRKHDVPLHEGRLWVAG